MPRLLGRSAVSSVATPHLSTWTIVEGKLVTPDALAFEILDVSSPEKENVPVVVVARTELDLTDDLVSTGRYVAPWSVPALASVGRHAIRWYATLVAGGAETTWVSFFDVVSNLLDLPQGDVYALVSDVREEGVGPSTTDRRIIEKIVECCTQLDIWTGRHFAPESKTITVDGSTTGTLVLNEVVIAVETLYLSDGFSDIERAGFVVYNRHLQGLRNPDDRDFPQIQFRDANGIGRFDTGYRSHNAISSPQWGGRAPQSVKIAGVFGYTDPDGSPMGRTPVLAKDIIVRMVLRMLPKQNTSAAQMKRREGQISSMKTREQTISWDMENGGISGASYNTTTRWTGDQSIDTMIEQLCIPISGGIV